MALNVVELTGSNVIAQGVFTHAADATPGFFTHWSTPSNIGALTVNVTNTSTVSIMVQVTRFGGNPTVVIEISAGNNRSVSVPDGQALQISSDAAAIVTGEYAVIKH